MSRTLGSQSMGYKTTFLLALLFAAPASRCQHRTGSLPAATLPAGTPLAVQIDDHLPMRVGQPIRAELIYPVYANNKLILPEHTVLSGTVLKLRSDRTRRIHARLGGD